MAEAFDAPEIGGDHFRSSAVFLTQSHPKQTQGSDLYVGTSLDQIVARSIGQDTAIPSMQLCIENLDQAGGCYYNYACAYTDTISWATPERAAADDSQSARRVRPAVRRRRHANGPHGAAQGEAEHPRLDHGRSGRRLKRELGAGDRRASTSTSRTFASSSAAFRPSKRATRSGEARELPEAPAGVPDSFEEHMKLMFDFQVLAFQSDMTRVISFKTGRDASSRAFPESGTNKGVPPGVAPRRP